MHKCAGAHDSITTLTKLKSSTSEQHVDLATGAKHVIDSVVESLKGKKS